MPFVDARRLLPKIILDSDSATRQVDLNFAVTVDYLGRITFEFGAANGAITSIIADFIRTFADDRIPLLVGSAANQCAARIVAQLVDNTLQELLASLQQQSSEPTELLTETMAAMGLPSAFRSTKASKKRRKHGWIGTEPELPPAATFDVVDVEDAGTDKDKVRYTPVYSAAPGAEDPLFTEYWSQHQQLLVYTAWLRLYHWQMAPESRQQFVDNLVDYDQTALIPPHRIRFEDYPGPETAALLNNDDVDWDDRWKKLTETDKFRQSCAKEFAEYMKLAVQRKAPCLTAAKLFLQQQGMPLGDHCMKGLGCRGVGCNFRVREHELYTEYCAPASVLLACDVTDFRPVNDYDFPVVLNKSNRPDKPDNCEQASTSTAEDDNSVADSGAEPDEVSFAFDAVRDAHLVARNGVNVSHAMHKYWRQRFRLFTKFNQGVLMDKEGWYSVTPEALAAHTAHRCCRPGQIVVDGFCGVGGNAIQFARQGAYVIAIDLDPVKIKCSRRNAQIYGVADRIQFVCANYFHAIGRIRADVVFLSPPWGGPGYVQQKTFDMHKHMTPDGFSIFAAARAVTPNVVLFMPRNTNIKQLVSLAAADGLVEIEQSFTDFNVPKLKALTAYYGGLVNQQNVD